MQELDELAGRWWAWRSRQQPRGRDDIPRLARPAGWLPQVGEDALTRDRHQRDVFAAELARLRPVDVPDRVDHRLLRSAAARITWELDVLAVWSRPRFWVDQSLGPVFDTLLRPGVDERRALEVVRFLQAVPQTLAAAPGMLQGRCVAPFARCAVDELADVEARVAECVDALGAVVPSCRAALSAAAEGAAEALGGLRDWLVPRLASLPDAAPVGRAAYDWFLREVACVPYDSHRVQGIGQLEGDRAAVLERVAGARPVGTLPPLPADAPAQCARQARDEQAVRAFYTDRGLLTQPATLRRYLNAPMPAYLEPLRFLGVTDDLTGPDRLDEDAVSYVPDPTGALPYFYAANARDPRLGIAHEGAHYQQLALSWAHPRPVRRHYYDSGPNEGIAFYNEELLLAAGLFDDAPASRTILYNMMRLRALRADVDVRLAVGDLDIPAAAEVLRTRVAMDGPTAMEEASFFAESPGQAITYQIGKTQILGLIADAAAVQDSPSALRRLHDSLWLNGNVPIALLRWELLGATDELEAIGVTG